MLTPDQFAEAPVYDLLKAAAEGKAGMDHRWLQAILDRGEEAVPDLVQFGTENLADYPVPVDEELLAIFQHLKSPASVPFFVEYLRRNGSDVPEDFVDAIYPVREAALEPLIELYDELEEDQAGEVAFCLAAFRIRHPRVLEILTDRLEYDLAEGAINLSLYGDPEARPALEKMLASTDDEHLRNQLQDAIDDLGREPEPFEEEFDIRDFFPEKARPETAVLEEADLRAMLDASDPEYRFTAAAGFINRDYGDDVQAALLNHARSDESAEVRAKCWEALGSDVADDQRVYEAMLARLRDETAPKIERAGALAGLGQRADEDAIRPYAEEFYHDPETRAAALAAMWNSLDRSFSIYFPPHLDDPDPEVRKQAISGVGYLGIYESAEKLRTYFDNDQYRPNALFAYALSARSEVSPGRMRSLLRRIDELAGGLSEEENELVEIALDERLLLHGHKPVFHPDHEGHRHEEAEPARTAKAGRNDPCPCGSGKKYKKCCGA
jgi:HEAT repeat protein